MGQRDQPGKGDCKEKERWGHRGPRRGGGDPGEGEHRVQLVLRLLRKGPHSGGLGSTQDEEGGHGPMVLGYLLWAVPGSRYILVHAV